MTTALPRNMSNPIPPLHPEVPTRPLRYWRRRARVGLGATLAGYVLRRAQFEPTPLIIGMVLGPVMERGLRQGLIVTRGDLASFVSRPITATLLAAAMGIVVYRCLRLVWRRPAAQSPA